MSSFSPSLETQIWSQKSQVKVHLSPEVPSTNDWAKSDISETPQMRLYLAQHQSAGRGRGTNTWSDSGGDSALLATWSLPLGSPPSPTFSLRLGLAVQRALTSTWGFIPFGIKPPNDIYVGPKKIGGLLIELVQKGTQVHLIFGMGLNVWKAPSLPHAACLAELMGVESLDKRDWHQFMDRLWLELALALSSRATPLSDSDRKSLTAAVNAAQGWPEKILRIESDGSLVASSGQPVPWLSL